MSTPLGEKIAKALNFSIWHFDDPFDCGRERVT